MEMLWHLTELFWHLTDGKQKLYLYKIELFKI